MESRRRSRSRPRPRSRAPRRRHPARAATPRAASSRARPPLRAKTSRGRRKHGGPSVCYPLRVTPSNPQGLDARPGRNGHPAFLVTGASGFVGGRVVKRLLRQGISVRAIVRETAELPPDERIEIVRGDFVDPETARRAVEGAQAVIHCAATAGPELEPVRRVNVDGTRALADAALEQRVQRFVQISTISVYDREGRPAIDEDSPLKTSGDPYGFT